MKKKIFILLLFLIIGMPFDVSAASVKVTLDCPSSAKASSTVSCKVKATPSGADLKGIKANINIEGGTYDSFTLSSGWASYSNKNTGFALGRDSGVTTTVTVGTLKVKMPKSGNAIVSLTKVEGSDSNYETLGGNSPSKTIKVQSTVNTLSSLSISVGELSPSFDSNTTSYSATVESSSITISGTATDSSATVTGLGKKNLKYGKNTFSVVVKSESGSKKTYTLTITRPDDRNTNNYLKSLSVSQGNISFNKNTTSYKVNVGSDVTSIKLNAEVEDSTASFVSGNGPRTVNLAYGENNINIKVKAENDQVRTYTITVNRKDNRSSDSTLSNLSIEPVDLNFDKNTTNYQVTVPYETEEVSLDYQVSDSKANTKVNGSGKLKVGTNKIVIQVTAENGKKTEYVIKITRQKEGERVLNSDSSLKELIVNGKNVELSEEKKYIVEVESETKLDIKAVSTEETSTIEILQPDVLEDGSIIEIIVTAEDGSKRTYLVSTIIKGKLECSSEKNNSFKVILLTALIVEVVNILIYKMLLRRTDNN